MAVVGKCCFFLSLETAVVIIGFISMAISFAGLLISTSSLLHYFNRPDDLLLQALLQVSFFEEIPGVVFHTILFLVSTILLYGSVSKIPPLLVPWLGWSPFVFTGIVVQLALQVTKRPHLALPLTSFTFMLLLFLIYATLIVAAYYRDILSSRVQLRIFNLQEGELPRVVEVPLRLASRLASFRSEIRDGPPIPSTASSSRPLHDQPRSYSDMGRRLQNAYGRFVAASRLSRTKTAENILPPRF